MKSCGFVKCKGYLRPKSLRTTGLFNFLNVSFCTDAITLCLGILHVANETKYLKLIWEEVSMIKE